MAVKLGLDCKLYYSATAGATATTELTNVKDLSLSITKGEADVTTRAAQGWKMSVGTLKEAEVTFDMVWDTTDTGFTAISTAFFSNAPIALAILDGDDGTGMDADFSIVEFSRNENLEEAVTVSVKAKPTLVTRAPVWGKITIA